MDFKGNYDPWRCRADKDSVLSPGFIDEERACRDYTDNVRH